MQRRLPERAEHSDEIVRFHPKATEHVAGLALADTLQHTGKYARGLEVATAARVEAQVLGWAPLTAALYNSEGYLLEKAGAFEPAEAALTEAFDLGVESGAWEAAADPPRRR